MLFLLCPLQNANPKQRMAVELMKKILQVLMSCVEL